MIKMIGVTSQARWSPLFPVQNSENPRHKAPISVPAYAISFSQPPVCLCEAPGELQMPRAVTKWLSQDLWWRPQPKLGEVANQRPRLPIGARIVSNSIDCLLL